MSIHYSGGYGVPRLDLGEAMLEYMWSREDFIGTSLLPVMRVNVKEAKFGRLRREALASPANSTKRAPGAAYSRGDFEAEDDSFACEERGHEVKVDDSQRRRYASEFDAERIATSVAMWRVLYDQEIAIRDAVIDTSACTTGNGLRTDVSTAWTDASADVIGDVQAAKDTICSRTGKEPNVLAVSYGMLRYFVMNTAIRAALGADKDKGIAALKNALTILFGVDRILWGKCVVNSANEGQDASMGYAWSTSWAVLAYVEEGEVPLEMPQLGRTPLWVNDSPDNVIVEEYMEPQTRSSVYRARVHSDEKILDRYFMQLLDIAG